MYFIYQETPQSQSIEMSCISMCESSLQHVTTLKSLVNIDILIVKRKNASSNTSILCTYCHWKNRVHWINTRWKKMSQSQKKYFFFLMTTSYNFALEIETSWARKIAKASLATWNTNDVVVYTWFIHSRIK